MSKNNAIPQKYLDLVGNEYEFKGGLFGRKSIPPTKFNVMGIRPSLSYIVNIKTMKAKHPAFELLLKNDSMRASRWSRPFPIREIKL